MKGGCGCECEALWKVWRLCKCEKCEWCCGYQTDLDISHQYWIKVFKHSLIFIGFYQKKNRDRNCRVIGISLKHFSYLPAKIMPNWELTSLRSSWKQMLLRKELIYMVDSKADSSFIFIFIFSMSPVSKKKKKLREDPSMMHVHEVQKRKTKPPRHVGIF